MKPCCHCQQTPTWYFARNTSRREGTDLWRLSLVCYRCEPFGKELGLVASADRAAVEARWETHAEGMFATYTATWTEPQRTAFRVRLFRDPMATELALVPAVTVQQIVATKKWNEEHPAAAEDFF
jgi:hypothetical protein